MSASASTGSWRVEPEHHQQWYIDVPEDAQWGRAEEAATITSTTNMGGEPTNTSTTTTTTTTTTSAQQGGVPIDVNGDGDVDIISADDGTHKVGWHENDGSESFVEHLITDLADGVYERGPGYLSAADIDEDGDLDVLSASEADTAACGVEADASTRASRRDDASVARAEAK